MNNNLNASKFKDLVKSKNFVVGVCGVLAVLVLVVGYNIRINKATSPVRVPVASHKLKARTQITSDDIETIEMPRSALGNNYYSKKDSLIGMYVNVDTSIPEGSLFYSGAVVYGEDLPDAALLEVPDGETLYYLTVNMLTSYTNSILPGRYIDIYVSTRENNQALVGKLLENVKVLQVKTADGENVFDDADARKVPYVVLFSLPEEQHLLLRKINAINNYSVANENGGFARIDITPVPTNVNINNRDNEIVSEVSSQYLSEYVLNLAAELPDEISNIDFNLNTGKTTKE